MKALAFGLAAALSLGLLSTGPAAAQSCDRQCLRTVADTYIDAMVAHDPAKAPLAPGVVTVENLAKIQPGAGLWKTLTAAPANFRIYVLDTAAQQIGMIAMLSEGANPAEVGIRLKLANGKIVEAEHVVVHNVWELGRANLVRPRVAFGQFVEEGYRDSRGRLVHIARSYYDALARNNSALAPFADDCQRRENGLITANRPVLDDPASESFGVFGAMGCAAQLDTGVMSYIDAIDNRRILVADEATGLALGFSHFRHSMANKDVAIHGVPGVTTRHLEYNPFDLPAVHVFKIWGGKIHEIEALGYITSYQHATGWE